MIDMIFGKHPVTRRIWCFHVHDGQSTPFTDEEMVERRRSYEKAIAEHFNKPFESDPEMVSASVISP